MEEKKHLLDYLEQILVIFGVSLLIVSVICVVVGDHAKGYSSMFEFGSEGIPVRVVFQYLLSSACITALRFLFFSDVLIKKMSMVKRTGCSSREPGSISRIHMVVHNCLHLEL